MSKPESVNLSFQEGSSDKVYNASLQQEKGGWVVNFSYGRRGNALQSGTKTPTPIDYDKAKKVYDKLVAEKTGKGYTSEEGGVPFSSSVEETRDTGIRPQLLNEIDEADVEKFINDPAYCAQEKHDGRRRCLVKNEKEAYGTNRKGLTIIASDKIINALKDLINDVELDSEDMGDHAMVFDVMFLNSDLRNVDYKTRYKMLQGLLDGNKILRLVETAWTAEEKRKLYNRLKKENAEGIVFKKINAPYKAGRPNSGGDQLKNKFCATASCIVKEVNKTKRSVSLQVFEGKKLIDVGNVTVYPNQEIPKAGTVVEVKYLYYFKEGSLFQPVLLGERDDIDAKDCVIKQLKLKKEEVE